MTTSSPISTDATTISTQTYPHWPSYDVIPSMHDYQKYAHDFIMSHPFCGLWLDMGMGKTMTTLSALYDLDPHHHVLVIAPLNIARSTWMDEIEKWKMPFRTRSLIVNEKGKKYTKQKRMEVYKEIFTTPDPTLWFINRELLVDLIDNMPTSHGDIVWPFHTVIIDESQSFKNYQSKRFKAFKRVRPQIERMIQLTGTPSPNGLLDLWPQIYLLDGGDRLGKSMTQYRDNFFYSQFSVNGIPVGWTPRYGAENEIYQRVSDIVVSMKNTHLKLPPVTYDTVTVHMDDKERKLYDSMARDSVLAVNENGAVAWGDLDDDVKAEFVLNADGGTLPDDVNAVIAQNAAVLVGKLSQMASGALYTDEGRVGDRPYQVIHEHKVDYVQHIVENTGSPVMIAYHFRSDLDMLEKRFEAKKIGYKVFDGSPDMVHAWNRDEIPVLLLQPASAGHGLNLQEGSGHTLIWYTIPWNLEEYLQCNARLYRQGQKNPVVIHHILTEGTIDDKILEAIENKDMSQRNLLAAVKANIPNA